MSEPKRPQPSLDPLIEGYLEYLLDVRGRHRERCATSVARYGG